MTADLVAVLDAEGVDRATVWGYSRGGWLACNLASRHADRVERIVVAAYAMNAHEEEVGRLLTPLAASCGTETGPGSGRRSASPTESFRR